MAELNIVPDDAFFYPELGWSDWRSLGWTKTAGGLNWRMLDRLGSRSADSDRSTPLRKQG